MKAVKKQLGKVSITIDKNPWDIEKPYDKLTLLYDIGTSSDYISRKPVPAGILINNKEYWHKLTTNSNPSSSIVIAQELGTRENIGISQKIITEAITALNEVSQVDLVNSRYVIDKDNRHFFIPMIELTKPNYPTISTTIYDIVTGNANVSVTNNTSGSIMYYSLDNGETWQITTGIIVIASEYSNSANNTTKTVDIKLKANLNGEESDINEVIITINPKVANGSISVTRTPNNNDYATAATITISPSASVNATSEYSTDGGSTWNTLSEATTINISETVAASTYKVRATKTGYVDAAVVSSTAIILNKKKFYYGMGDTTLANEADIQALIGGNSVEKDNMAGEYDITVTTTGKYIWFCGSGTLTSVTSEGFTVPMESVIVVDGYNCYRSSSAVQETGTNTFNVE